MAKFAREETKSFSPIDSKLLGTLAETPQAEPAQAPPSIAPPTRPAEPAAKPKAIRPGPPPETKHPSASVARQQPENERLTRVVKCLFTATEEQEIRSLINRLRENTGVTLSISHLTRPFFDLLLHSEAELTEELANAGLRRPINDKNALAAFERELAAVILAAFQRTGPKTNGKKP